MLTGCGLIRKNDLPTQYSLNKFKLDGSVKIDVYVNDEIMDVKVFPKETGPNLYRPDNTGDYILAQPIANFLDTVCSADEQNNELRLSSEVYGDIEYPFDSNAKYIKDKLYIRLTIFKMLTNGFVRQDDAFSMYLYTGDYERTDLPATLLEAYLLIDEVLTDEQKDMLKNMSEEDIAKERYGLGVWIQNNWLFSEHCKLAEYFDENGVDNNDRKIEIIIKGYVKYLNNHPSEIEDLLND